MCREPEPDHTSIQQSIQMLHAVLDGATYERVGSVHGVTRTAVERRVKDVARRVIRLVGVEGLSEDGVAFVQRLRAHGDSLRRALEVVDPDMLETQKKDRSLRVYTTEEIVAAAGRVRAYSSQPLRDVAMFLLLFATGARPLEIARLQVRDYLEASGEVRRVSVLRAEAAINGAARPLHFASTRLNEALMPYLLQRGKHGSVGTDGRAYCGLEPGAPLFLATDGEAFAITSYTQGGQRRFLCRPILETYRKIFRHAGLPGATALAVRTTVAARLYARGAEDRQVGQLLGIAQRSSVRQLFPRNKPTLAQLAEELI